MIAEAVSARPLDQSPYGVQGLTGNAMDWCADPYRQEGPEVSPEGLVRPLEEIAEQGAPRAMRGGAWNWGGGLGQIAYRSVATGTYAMETVGFRLARAL